MNRKFRDEDRRRGSRHARGYDARWVKLRASALAREPLCRACAASGRVTAAVEVDHITPKHIGGSDDASNLQPLCAACHADKTAREQSAGGLAKGCDASGMPTDPNHPWRA